MPLINFANEKKQIEVPVGANLRREALKAHVQLYPHIHQIVNCHGLGQCGSCKVVITKGQENASRAGLWERMRMLLVRIGHKDQVRLACCTRVNGDMEVITRPPMQDYLFGENFFS